MSSLSGDKNGWKPYCNLCMCFKPDELSQGCTFKQKIYRIYPKCKLNSKLKYLCINNGNSLSVCALNPKHLNIYLLGVLNDSLGPDRVRK